MLDLGVEDDDVGVEARRDRALLVEAEDPRRAPRAVAHEVDDRHVPCAHGAVVEQRQPVLDRRQPVRDLREVAEPELLLLLEVERAVVGRDALQRALAQRLVEHLLVVRLAQRRRADVLGALEARPVEVVDGQVEVLDAGLAEDRQAAVARRLDLLDRLLAGDVHDEQRPLRPLREPDRARPSPRPRPRAAASTAWNFGSVLPASSASFW